MSRGEKWAALKKKDDDPKPRRSLRSLRKRPVQPIVISDDEDSEELNPLPEVKKQKLSSLRGHIKSFSSNTPQSTRSPTPELPKAPSNLDQFDQWIDKYSPKSTSEVAIHSKKLAEVKEDLELMISGDSPYRILLLSGPAGSSKSTVAKCLGRELIPAIRHTQPSETDIIEFTNDDSIESTVTQFSDFLDTVKYRTGKNLSMVLVEDLPNVFHGPTRDNFQQALQQWLYKDLFLPPLVLCVTECEFPNDGPTSQGFNIDNNFIVETILGRKLLMNPQIKRIKFNPVNMTLTRKCLTNIVSQEGDLFNNIPRQEILDKIKELSDNGDIRSSIAAFQFWASYRSKHDDSRKFISIGKEPSISLFHAIGKCIFGTKNEEEDDITTLDKVLNDFISKPNILKLGILENYTKFNKANYDLESACDIAENLSVSDLFGNDDSSIEFAARSTRTVFRNVNVKSSSNGSNHSGATFPREWKVQRGINATKSDILRYIETELKRRQAYRTFQDSNLLYGYYEPIINKQRGFKNRARIHYLKTNNKTIPKELLVSSNPFISERLGGPFKEVFGDSDIVPDEEITRDRYFKTSNIKDDDSSSFDSSDDSELENDPIVDTDADDEAGDEFGDDDTFEKELVNLSQKPDLKATTSTLSNGAKPNNAEFLNDFDDDDFDDSDF
ncbi:unnamed protein product [Wickerhamomyces anomalus]